LLDKIAINTLRAPQSERTPRAYQWPLSAIFTVTLDNNVISVCAFAN